MSAPNKNDFPTPEQSSEKSKIEKETGFEMLSKKEGSPEAVMVKRPAVNKSKEPEEGEEDWERIEGGGKSDEDDQTREMFKQLREGKKDKDRKSKEQESKQ